MSIKIKELTESGLCNRLFMHYVIGGHGDLGVLLHGWPQS